MQGKRSSPSSRPPLPASAARWIATAALGAPWLGAVALAGVASREIAWRGIVRWAEVQRRLFGLEVVVHDRNHGAYGAGTSYIFVGLNQASLADALVWFAAMPRPARFVANVEFLALPALGPALLAAGAIPIVRQWPAQARLATAIAERALRAGQSVAISIEGRRSPDGALSPFKRGPALLAIATGATIVPLVMKGHRDRLPYGEWRVRPGVVEATLCEFVPCAGMTFDDRQALTAQLHQIAERELRA